jgi:MFS family permease
MVQPKGKAHAPSASGDSGWRDLRGPQGFSPGSYRLPDTPFARLGVAHAACAAGDALVTIALAKTLFFVSPNEARGKVILYLVLTLAPFAVVSPFVGPLIDRFKDQRRWVVVLTTALRAVLCLLMAQDVTSLRLFPEAFVALVLSKGYAVARSSLVPTVVSDQRELVRANSRLSLIGGLSGFVIAIPGGLLSSIPHLGAPWVLGLAFFVFGASAAAATRIQTRADLPDGMVRTADGQLTLPAGGRVRERPEPGTARAKEGANTKGSAKRPLFATNQHPLTLLRLATVAMSVQRGLVGMVTFLVAFTLKREGGSTAWLGLMGAAGLGGGLIGAAIAPKLRNRISEERILIASLFFVFVSTALATVRSTRPWASWVAFAVGMAAGVSRLAFDSLVQRDSGDHERGAMFARYETRFQLAWVLGALIPVVFPISRFIGFAVMTFIVAAAIAVQIGGESALHKIDATVAAGAQRWRSPERPAAEDWVDGDLEP